MNKAVPWSIKGVDFDARTAAKEAARRAGMTLGEWLNSVIAEQAAEQGLDPDEIGEDERVAAVRNRLERMSPAGGPPQGGAMHRRRNDRTARQRPSEPQLDHDEEFDDPAPMPGARMRSSMLAREAAYAPARPSYFQNDHDDHRGPYRAAPARSLPGAESLLDDAVRSFERRTRRESAETHAALDHVARRLENIEGRLETRHSEPEPDRTLKRVIARLESRIEALASREDAPVQKDMPARTAMGMETSFAPAPHVAPHVMAPAAAPVHMAPEIAAVPQAAYAQPVPAPAAAPQSMRSSDLVRIEAKLNKLLEREAQATVAGPEFAPAAVAAMRPVAADEPAGFFAHPRGVTPSRRPLQDAIAEINRRQADLDRGFSRAGSNFAPPRAQQRNLQQATAFASAMPAHPPAAPASASDVHSELRTTVTSLKGEIADLSRHIEFLRSDATRPENISTSIHDALAGHAIAPELNSLRQQIENLRRESAQPGSIAQSIKEALSVSPVASELDTLRGQIADMTATIAKLAPLENLSSLETAIRQLGEQVSQSRRDDGRNTFLAPVEELIADMKRTLADFAPRAAVTAIEREIQAINRNIETMARSGVDPATFAKACEQTAEIRNLLASAVARPLPLENIEKQISGLARRVDLIATRGPTPVGVNAVNESVGEIRAAMQDAAPAPLLIALEQRIEELARKIDEAAARPAPANAQLDTISQRLDTMQQTLAWQSERQPVAKVDTGLLEGMLQQIMDRVNKPAPVAEMPDLESFEKSLRDLASRVEDISRQPELDGFSGLEERLAKLAARLDQPAPAHSGLGEVERTLNHLASQLEENRLSAIDAASNAARSAARDVLEEFSRASGNPAASLEGARDLIAREINGLRSLQDASDRRTHATLGAVHETLEKVVDRLAMLEEDLGARDIEDVAPPARQPFAEADQLSSGPAPVFSRATAAPDVPPAPAVRDEPLATPAVQVERRAEPAASVREAPVVQPPAAMPAAQRAGMAASAESDFLIEPGSGKKPSRTAPSQMQAAQMQPVQSPAAQQAPASAPAGETEPEPNIHGRASASNFIAAARRAQQAAQAQADVEAAQQPPPKRGIKSLTPDNALAEARSRAKAAASILSGTLKKGQPKADAEEPALAAVAGDKPAKSRSLFSSRKVLFSLAGLVLVLGALTIIRQNMARPPAPRPVAATPAPAQPQADRSDAQQSPAPATATTLSTAPLPSTQFTPAATASPNQPASAAPANPPADLEQRSDRAPVSSIPSMVTGAAPAANNLRMAANSGDPNAQYELAVRLADGRLENRDPSAAAQLLEKAAQKGLAPAQYRLGSLYEKGIGVEKNFAQARHWYEQAASAGNVKAMHNFAVLLAEGGDGKADYATAASWFKRAAEHGVRDSQYNLAILYARGLGIEQSMIDAYVWLALAEAQGDADAGSKRGDVAKRLSPGQLSEANERVKRFRAQKALTSANDVPAPAGGWRSDPVSAGASAPAAPSFINAPPPARTAPAKRPKVSSL